MASLRSRLAACTLLVAGCVAQVITPTNLTDFDAQDNNTFMYSDGSHDTLDQEAPLLPLTPPARETPSQGISGPAFIADSSNSMNITTNQIVLISCDDEDYPGNIDAAALFRQATGRNAQAIVFYSKYSDFCNLANAPQTNNYPWVFSFASVNAARSVTDELMEWGTTAPGFVIGDAALGQSGSGGSYGGGGSSIGIQGTGQSAANGVDSDNDNNHNTLGPSPSTAVAMIILYSITGIITALFLSIIITGAVRAHRHPERYGPRAMLGMPRQSRAKGLGRAILDTIPIVKVGQRGEQPKPTDVELGDRSTEPETAHDKPHFTSATTPESEQQQPTATTSSNPNPTHDHEPPPIASATAASPSTNPDSALESENIQGCSICTDDFLPGQDQRVLPCDHRYHPQCIDPWLLNVSSTCPLCRIDLRPPQNETSEGGETADESLGEGAAQRRSVRRSLMAGVLGLGAGAGVERLSREERVAVLRRYRAQVAAGRGVEAGREEDAGGERGRRERLRALFSRRGIRTRDGEGGSAEGEASARATTDG